MTAIPGDDTGSGHATDGQHSDIHATMAAQMQRQHPRWLVLWGPYSREFWAYPCLPVPPGTLVHAPDPEMLVAGITEIETLVTSGRYQPGWPGTQPAPPSPPQAGAQ